MDIEAIRAGNSNNWLESGRRDLSGVDLCGINLAGATLVGAFFWIQIEEPV